MEFRATEELEKILIAFGFWDATKQEYPTHYKEIQSKKLDYSSNKRSFKYPGRIEVIFDYININIVLGNTIIYSSIAIPFIHLASFLTFCQLSPYPKKKFRDENRKIYEIPEFIEHYDRFHQNRPQSFHWKVKGLYDSVRDQLERLTNELYYPHYQ